MDPNLEGEALKIERRSQRGCGSNRSRKAGTSSLGGRIGGRGKKGGRLGHAGKKPQWESRGNRGWTSKPHGRVFWKRACELT